MFDLLVKDGLVIDPSQQLNKVMDVAFKNGKVAALSPDIDVDEASRVINASKRLLTPGLIDIHTRWKGSES